MDSDPMVGCGAGAGRGQRAGSAAGVHRAGQRGAVVAPPAPDRRIHVPFRGMDERSVGSARTVFSDDSVFMHPTDLPSITRLSGGALAAVWQRRVNKATSGDRWQYECVISRRDAAGRDDVICECCPNAAAMTTDGPTAAYQDFQLRREAAASWKRSRVFRVRGKADSVSPGGYATPAWRRTSPALTAS